MGGVPNPTLCIMRPADADTLLLVALLPSVLAACDRIRPVLSYLPPGNSVSVETGSKGPLAAGCRVLVAEDADDLRMLAVLYLKRLGHAALEAANGQEAVQLTLNEQPDAVLMDMEMPVLHGLDAVRQLRAAGYGKPILAVTAHTDWSSMQKALLAGCNETLRKPLGLAQLKAALDNALGSGTGSARPTTACEAPACAAQIVVVSKDLEALIPLFLSTRRTDLAKLETGLANRDFGLIVRTGHSMKGAGGAYGFDAISRMADLIERAALREDEGGVRTQLAAFRHYMANLQVRLV